MTTLSEVLQTVIRIFTRTDDDVVLTDIHFQPVSETGELFVFDDEDKPIAHAVVESWADLDDEAFLPTVRVDLEKAIAAANADGALERLAVWKPYSLFLSMRTAKPSATFSLSATIPSSSPTSSFPTSTPTSMPSSRI